MTTAFVESGVAAALKSLDKALDEEAALDREMRRYLLLAYEQLRGVTELIEVERRIEATIARSRRAYPTPPRAVPK